MNDLQTLNPLTSVTDTESMVIWSCYSTLLMRDVEGNMVGDLATSWTISPDGLTWGVKIVSSAKFYDRLHPAADRSVTVDDVAFTYWLIQNTTGNGLKPLLPDIPAAGGGLIESIAKTSDFELQFHLRTQYAPFVDSMTKIPILPKYIWQTYQWSWDNYDSGNAVPPCVGSGPWSYSLDGIPMFGYVALSRSPSWFATEEYGWQLRVNTLILNDEIPEGNYANYLAGENDIMLDVTRNQFLNGNLPGTKWASSQGSVLEFNMNQLTEANRALYDIGGTFDYNNQLLLDPAVKLALQMSIDKSAIVSQTLGGLGEQADSLMPSVSPWHYTYGSVPGEVPILFDTAGARTLLNGAGWTYDTTGAFNPGATPLCKVLGSDPLSFRFITPDTDTKFHDACMYIDAWAAQAGIQLDYNGPSTAMYMNSAWYTADYDAWYWDWPLSPDSEPSLDVQYLLTTDAIGTWSDVYWSNSIYDSLYVESIAEMNACSRAGILNEMQRMAYLHSGCWPVAWEAALYAAQGVAPEYWQNYGNWSENFRLTPDSSYPWLFMRIFPADNPPPVIADWISHYETDVNTAVQLSPTASDSSSLEYRWDFGDGTETDWSATPSATHLYVEDGHYSAYFMAREVDSADGYISWAKATVSVQGSNRAPHDLNFTYEPLDPDNGIKVHLNATALDDEGDPLYFSWNFGDGRTASGPEVVHQFMDVGDYLVTLCVDDMHLGSEPRPVSLSKMISVAENSPPSVLFRDETAVPDRTLWSFYCLGAELDSRDRVRITWAWGDGTVSVTNHHSTGGSFLATADHSYFSRGEYSPTVWIDDLTGLPGHNTSDTGRVPVIPIAGYAPQITDFLVSNSQPGFGQEVTFYVTAVDQDQDLLLITVDFGDGQSTSVWQPVVNGTIAVTHSYSSPGVYLAVARAFDNTFLSNDEAIHIEVSALTSFSLGLVAGWNLVCVPLVGNGYAASTLDLSFGDVVAGWNSTTQSYDKNFIVGLSPSTSDFPIREGSGYWIYSGAARSLTILGDLPTETQTVSVDVPTGGGWVALAFVGLNDSRHASDVPEMYSGPGRISTVVKYDELSGVYKSWYPDLPVPDFLLVPGHAFWCWCTASGTITYDP